MNRSRNTTNAGGISARLLLAGAILGLALPTAGMALGGFDGKGVSLAARGSFASFTPASVSPDMTRQLVDRSDSKGRLMRFTPAGTSSRPDRSVTVAVRVDDETAKAISVRSALAMAQATPGTRTPEVVVLAPTRFNLGMARGYRSFAQPVAKKETSQARLADLSTFSLADTQSKADAPRFGTRVTMAGKADAMGVAEAAGVAPTFDNTNEKAVDVAGRYRVMRNLDVTAGVRYSQERDRLAPLTDGAYDNQAVYVGTRFRF